MPGKFMHSQIAIKAKSEMISFAHNGSLKTEILPDRIGSSCALCDFQYTVRYGMYMFPFSFDDICIQAQIHYTANDIALRRNTEPRHGGGSAFDPPLL